MAAAHRNVPAILQKHGYAEIRKIGEGSFGRAILVQAKDGSRVVCKMIDVSKAGHRETQAAVKEGQLLASLKHPYIVRYRENFTDSGWFCILMDYCEGGDLTKQIEQAKRSRTHIPEEQVLRWLTQAILALKYIHDRHILHRDLKPGNFFLSKSGSLKMGDFGIAKVLSCTIACARTQIGTPYYLSPEVCQEKPYAWGSDIWAMGCILYELCANRVPFDAPNISGLVQKITRGPIPTVPSPFSPFVREICGQMLNRNPNSRPSTDEILKRPQIQGIVRQMLDEVQGQDAGNGGGGGGGGGGHHKREVTADPQAAELPAAPPAPAGPPGPGGGFRQGDPVEYLSSTHNDWLPATVLKVDGGGNIVIDLKPNTWISKDDQLKKVRRRRPSPRATPSSAAATPSLQQQRSPSVGARSPSVGAALGRGGNGGGGGGCVGGQLAVPQPRRSPSASALERNPPQAGALERPGGAAAVIAAAAAAQRDYASQPPSRASSPRPCGAAGVAAVAAAAQRDFSPQPPSRASSPRRSPSPAAAPRRGRDATPRRAASPHGGGLQRPEGERHSVHDTPRIKPPCMPRAAEPSPLRRRNPAAGAAGAAIAGA